MRAAQNTLVRCLQANNQFKIPIYQRTYNWNKDHCKQLFDDIVKVGDGVKEKTHFIGAITLLDEPNLVFKNVNDYQIIDGQQRLTTTMLLLKALKENLSNNAKLVTKEQIDQLLFNVNEKSEEYFKLNLTDEDNHAFRDILENSESESSNNITANFKYFQTWISQENDTDKIWRGINRLAMVEIHIEKEDNAQVIFESMNSTGLDLSQTDMIQNYILMSKSSPVQKTIYNDYWRPMEKYFEGERGQLFDEFLRNYLMMKRGGLVTKNGMYAYFKEYAKDLDTTEEIKNIWKYSKYYANLITITKHPIPKLKKVIDYIYEQDTNVAYSFLLKVLADHDAGLITTDDAEEIFLLVDSFLLRCHVCEMTKAGNKLFPELIPKLDSNHYAKDFEKILMKKAGNRRFPRDITFKDKLKQLPLYINNNMCKYVLVRLEHAMDPSERTDTDNLEIEHIMPKTLNNDWKRDLGSGWEDIHEKYLHTIGNLTLTGYNPELSNKSFSSKLPIYKDSKIELSKNLKNYQKWDKVAIEERTNDLITRAAKLWVCPKGYESITENDDESNEDEYLEGRHSVDLWQLAKNKILDACDGITFRMTRVYGTFRTPIPNSSKTIGICGLEALSDKIRIVYNVKIDDNIIKKSKFVEDVSNVGHYATGDLRSTIMSEDDIKKAIKLIQIIYKKKLEKYTN